MLPGLSVKVVTFGNTVWTWFSLPMQAGGLALCAYKLLPALEFAANVVRPVSLRISGDLLSLMAGAAVSLFVPQLLSHIDRAHLVVDRAELDTALGSCRYWSASRDLRQPSGVAIFRVRRVRSVSGDQSCLRSCRLCSLCRSW